MLVPTLVYLLLSVQCTCSIVHDSILYTHSCSARAYAHCVCYLWKIFHRRLSVTQYSTSCDVHVVALSFSICMLFGSCMCTRAQSSCLNWCQSFGFEDDLVWPGVINSVCSIRVYMEPTWTLTPDLSIPNQYSNPVANGELMLVLTCVRQEVLSGEISVGASWISSGFSVVNQTPSVWFNIH